MQTLRLVFNFSWRLAGARVNRTEEDPMCRLLAIRSPEPIAVTSYLEKFARVARESREYQGHGWGLAYRVSGQA